MIGYPIYVCSVKSIRCQSRENVCRVQSSIFMQVCKHTYRYMGIFVVISNYFCVLSFSNGFFFFSKIRNEKNICVLNEDTPIKLV